jgi:hypothetical protein
MRWLDFSGAPPVLIPQSLAPFWRGTTNPVTGNYSELNTDQPVTDYDRACAVAWPGRSVLDFMGSPILVLYTEFDLHTWDPEKRIVACGGWFPSEDELRRATWTDGVHWQTQETNLWLMNSAVDAERGISDDDYLPVHLEAGSYTIEYSDIEAQSVGCFHRFIS